MVLPAGGEARFPPFRGRLRGDAGRCARRSLSRIGHTLRPLEIVVVNTARRLPLRRGRTTSTAGCGMGKAATLWLLERGVRLVGTDGWSWDAPFSPHASARCEETGDAGLIWEGHRAGREIGYSHLEKLHNLEALPADGFEIVLLSGEGASRLGRLDARGRDPAGIRSEKDGLHGAFRIALTGSRANRHPGRHALDLVLREPNRQGAEIFRRAAPCAWCRGSADLPKCAELYTETCLARTAANIELSRGDADVLNICRALRWPVWPSTRWAARRSRRRSTASWPTSGRGRSSA